MPLHLLGKKSWNVYSPANIARVRRDEAAARAREEAEEQRMQEADAARRLAILRGEAPPPLEPSEPESSPVAPSAARDDRRDGRKRKRPGEDDTDFEMRVARERRAEKTNAACRPPAPLRSSASLLPSSLVDGRGHISLFPEAEAEAETTTTTTTITRRRPPPPSSDRSVGFSRREERQPDDQGKDAYQMRFANAAGRDGQGLTDGGPWYASADGDASAALVPSRDVWGREDPGRKAREAARLHASDPLAVMKRGAARVRELERERRREAEARERELEALRREERRREGKRRKGGEEDVEERDRRGKRSPDREHRRHRDGDQEERHGRRSRERDRRRPEEHGHERRRDGDDDRHHGSSRSDQDRDRDRHRSSHR